MTLTAILAIVGAFLVLSVVVNIFLFLYIRKSLATIIVASEEVSEIFSMLDSYGEHLQSVHEMPLFYGDETLKGLLDHTRDLVSYLKKYEEVYSFTQPDLEEQLLAASQDLNNDNQEETQEETE